MNDILRNAPQPTQEEHTKQLTFNTKITRHFLNSLFKAPIGLKRLLAGPACKHNEIALDLNTQLVCKIDRIGQRIMPRAASIEAIQDTRKLMAMSTEIFAPYKTEHAVKAVNTLVNGKLSKLAATIYTPENTSNGTILYFHGGGWVLGSHHTHDPVCRSLAAKANVQIISVDYRLAPEFPYPAANEDVIEIYKDILNRAEQLEIISTNILVAGDSAGGYLATYVALTAEKMGLPRPLGQILFYPVTDVSGQRNRSTSPFAHGFLLTGFQMERFEALYFSDESYKDEEKFSPIASSNLAVAPPSLIVTAGFDILGEEGTEYAKKLENVGVHVIHKNIVDQVHGFLSIQLACQSTFDDTASLVKNFISNISR